MKKILCSALLLSLALGLKAQTGNVGIGTTTPSTKLDVVGDLKASTIIISEIPSYATEYDAHNDASLPMFALYKLNDSRVVYIKDGTFTDNTGPTVSTNFYQALGSNNPPPVAPCPGTDYATAYRYFTINKTISDPAGIASVIFKVNGVTISSPEYTMEEVGCCTTSTSPVFNNQTFLVEIIATDNAGNVTNYTQTYTAPTYFCNAW